MMDRRATSGDDSAAADSRGGGRRPATAVPQRAARAEQWREIGPVALVLALTLTVLAGLAVLPARTWWAQRQSINEAQAELVQAQDEVASLRAQRDLLATDAEVERLARQDYDLVYPGEESYRIVSPSGATASP
jgi:cell division protein FtsB